MGSSLISFFYFDTSLRISISRLESNQAASRFLNTFISLSDLIQCLVEQLYNEPAVDAYSCYFSFLLYVYPSPLALLYYSNIIFQAYCANLSRYCVFFVSFYRQRWCLTCEWLVWIRFSIWIMLCNLEFLEGVFDKNSLVFSQFLS